MVAGMTFVVESGIPLPPPRAGSKGGRRPRSPVSIAVSALEPGQSILFTEEADWLRMRGLWHVFGPGRLASRKMRDGWRVWRTA